MTRTHDADVTRTRDAEQGVVLINVLVILAISSTIVYAMLRLSDDAITRSSRFADAGQGLALIAGAEATAIAALRRDAPETDHSGEAWAAVAQDQVAIDGGSFSLAIADAQGRFNLNNLARGNPEDGLLMQRILAALDLPEVVGLRLVARMADPTPLTSLDDLVSAGIDAADVAQLATLATVLPRPTRINLNTMPDAMFAVLAGNPVQARLLQGLRARKGQLTAGDLLGAGVILNSQIGLTSDHFTITTHVAMGETRQGRDSLLYRFTLPGTGPQVVVAARRPVP